MASGGGLGTIWTEFRLRMDRLQTDIDTATADLQTGHGAMERLTQESQDRIAESTSNLSDCYTKVGQTATAAGAVIAAGLGLAIKVSSDFQTAQTKLQTQLGITKEEAAALGETARQVWKGGFGEDLAGVTESVGKVKAVFKDLNDNELKQFIQGAYAITAAWGPEIDEVNKTVKSMTGSFQGLSENDALDIITVGFQQGGDYAQDLMDTLWEYSPQFAAMGFNAQEFMSTLIAGAQGGAFNMDKLGDSIKEFGIRAQDGSKTSAEGFKILGLDAEQMATNMAAGGEKAKGVFMATVAALSAMDDPLAQSAAGVALFGTQWEDVKANAVLAMGDAKNKTLEFTGASQQASATMQQGLGPQMEKLSRVAQDIGISIGDKLAPAIGVLATFLTTLLNGFTGLSGPMQTTIAVVAALTAGILLIGGPILMFLGFLPTMAAGLAMVTAVFAGFNLVMLMNPIVLVVAAIVALIAIGVALYKNWDTITAKLSAAWGTIKAGAENTWNRIADFFTVAIPAKLEAMVAWFSALPGRLLVFLLKIAKDAPCQIGLAIGGMVRLAYEGIEKVVGFFMALPGKTLTFLTALVTGAAAKWEEMKTNATTTARNTVDSVVSFFSELPGKVWNYISQLPGKIQTGGSQMATSARQTGINVRDGLIDGIKGIPSKIYEIFANSVSTVTQAGERLFNAAKQAAAKAWKGFKDGLGIHSPSYIEEAFFNIMDTSEDTVKNLTKDFNNIARMNVTSPSLEKAAYGIGGACTPGAGNSGTTTLQFNGPITIYPAPEPEGNKTSSINLGRTLYDQIAVRTRAFGKGGIASA